MTDVQQIISELEQQRTAIDQAIAALRGIHSRSTPTGKRSQSPAPAPTKRGITPEGKQRLAESMRRRWAAKRAATVSKKRATAGVTTKKQARTKVARKKSATKTISAGQA